MQLINLLPAALLILGTATPVISTAIPSDLTSRNPNKPTTYHPDPHEHKSRACPNYCLNTSPNQTLYKTYVCGNPLLGPIKLPSKLPLFDLVDDYSRFGSLCPGEWLAKYYNATAKSFIYPPKDGFQLDVKGVPIEGIVLLEKGRLLDRFGGEFGRFVSPEGAPYNQRALPPVNLNTPEGDRRYPSNYHVYRVVKAFEALSGPIAGWFEQPGQGVQYQLNNSIKELLEGGFLEPVSLSEL